MNLLLPLRIAWIVVVSCFLVTGCTLANPLSNAGNDYGILSRQPCRPRCFENIRLGVTTEQEARSVMKNMGQSCQDWDLAAYGKSRGVSCNSVDIDFTDGKVG
jgi:hypothetical protein